MFVTFVTGKKLAQNFFSLPLFLLESLLSMYFPFVTFVTLIFAWTRKSLLRSFHIVNDERDDLSLTFPLLRLLRGKRWPRIFLVIFVSSGVRTLNVFSIRYFRYADFCMAQEKPVTFVSHCKW